jgi:hypothetical protein
MGLSLWRSTLYFFLERDSRTSSGVGYRVRESGTFGFAGMLH